MGMLAEPKKQAKTKGLIAGAAWGATGLALALGWGWFPVLVGVGASGYLTYAWLMFRGKWGIRF